MIKECYGGYYATSMEDEGERYSLFGIVFVAVRAWALIINELQNSMNLKIDKVLLLGFY